MSKQKKRDPFIMGTALVTASVLVFSAGCSVAHLVNQANEVNRTTARQAYAQPVEVQAQTALPVKLAKMDEEPAATYTAAELDTLALIIYQEAGADYCSDVTRLMVGTVFVNRVESPYFPDTFEEVATEYCQYGLLYWTGLEWPEQATLPEEAHAVERAYRCAERVLNGERVLPADVVYQSENIQGTEIVAESDGIYFCR